MSQKTPNVAAPNKKVPAQLAILLIVVAVFAGILLVKSLSSPEASPAAPDTVVSITSTRNDAVADYESALAAGKPVYVLFHSLTCVPCVEISEVADTVIPEYEGKVTFVNAITDDPAGQQLSANFSFQYIPTSFFLKADGTIADSFTGALTADAMRAYLDTLVAQ